MPGQLAGVLAQLLLVAAADDQYLDVGESLDQRRKCPDQRGHPLARLVEPAEEQYGLACTRVPVQARRRCERLDVDAVGNLDGIRAERLHLPAPGQIGHRDAADDLLVVAAGENPERR